MPVKIEFSGYRQKLSLFSNSGRNFMLSSGWMGLFFALGLFNSSGMSFGKDTVSLCVILPFQHWGRQKSSPSNKIFKNFPPSIFRCFAATDVEKCKRIPRLGFS